MSDIPLTLAHDNLKRQRFVGPGELKSKVQTVNYVELVPGKSFTPHTHPDCEECFFVVDGKAEATVEGEEFELNKGDFLLVEPGEKHVFLNTSQKTFKYFQFRILV